MLDKVKHVILVLSGKGGVGKSTISTQLALTLKEFNLKVGILDIDLCGPSIPFLLGLEGKDVFQCEQGWVPVYTDESKNLAVMSIGFLLKNRNDAVIWRGPKKTAMIRQFLNDVCWDEIDYLIIDTPPGTSDEHIVVMESMKNFKCDGAIIITTPQEVAMEDVRKEITFCRKTGIKIIGIIENMSGYVCPHCSTCTNIFSSEGGKQLASYAKVDHLGTLPIDPNVCSTSYMKHSSVVSINPESTIAKIFSSIVQNIISKNQNK